MVIIKVNCQVHPKTLAQMRASVRKQAETGVVTVPPYCEVLAEVPNGTEVEVITGDDNAGDCGYCSKSAACKYYRPAVYRINCPLWRAKG